MRVPKLRGAIRPGTTRCQCAEKTSQYRQFNVAGTRTKNHEQQRLVGGADRPSTVEPDRVEHGHRRRRVVLVHDVHLNQNHASVPLGDPENEEEETNAHKFAGSRDSKKGLYKVDATAPVHQDEGCWNDCQPLTLGGKQCRTNKVAQGEEPSAPTFVLPAIAVHVTPHAPPVFGAETDDHDVRHKGEEETT